MVLLADIVSDDADAVGEAASAVVRIANLRGAEGFVAVTAEARKRFWLDRARTAAIAKHTNAFKINEDVVIPLERLGDYSDGIERINIELSLKNKIRLMDALEGFLAGELPLHQEAEQVSPPSCSADRVEQALALVRVTRLALAMAARATWTRQRPRMPASGLSPRGRTRDASSCSCRTARCASPGSSEVRDPLLRAVRRPRLRAGQPRARGDPSEAC